MFALLAAPVNENRQTGQNIERYAGKMNQDITYVCFQIWLCELTVGRLETRFNHELYHYFSRTLRQAEIALEKLSENKENINFLKENIKGLRTRGFIVAKRWLKVDI